MRSAEAGETEVFASIWDTSTFTETSHLSLGVQEGHNFYTSLLTEDYIVLHSGRSHQTQVCDRATGEELLEVAASGNLTEHDRAQNRICQKSDVTACWPEMLTRQWVGGKDSQ